MRRSGERPAALRAGPLQEVRGCFRDKRWSDLERLLDDAAVWAFDRPLDPDEAVELLRAVFDDAADPSLLVLEALESHAASDGARHTYRCCVVWSARDSWREHEMEFELHLGTRIDSNGQATVSQFGVTYPRALRA